MLAEIDKKISDILWPVTRKWCKVTGRDNTSLARFTVVIGCAIIIFGLAKDAVTADGVFTVVMCMFGCIIWSALAVWDWKVMGKFRVLQDDPSDVINVDYPALVAFLMIRSTFRLIFTTIVFVLFFVMLPYISFFCIGYTMWTAAYYFALHIHPGGKSVLSRLKDKAREGIEKAKSLLPTPTPAPIPVGAAPGTHGRSLTKALTQVRQAIENGEKLKDVAFQHGISIALVSAIKHRKRYAHE